MTRRRRMFGPALLMLASMAAAPIVAKGVAKPDVRPRAGLWQLEGAGEGAQTCLLRLSGEQTIGGRGAATTGRCKTAYPWTDDIMAWHTDPVRPTPATIILTNAERHAIARFVLVDTGEVYTATVAGVDYALYPPLPPPKSRKKKGPK